MSLKVPVAKLVIKDLIKGDGALVQVIELTKLNSLQNEQISLLKQKDSLKDEKIKNFEIIIAKKDEQFALERSKSESLLKELKSQRRKTFFYKVGTVVAVFTTASLLLK